VIRATVWSGVIAAAFVSLLSTAPAQAQATRTWVSGVGDDANPCSRTAPCKTFAGAISKTAANGEINVIDPGGFGAVTITKSITIDGAGSMASILASLTTGVIVNAGAGDVVILRNLSINGAGNGINGIRFLAGAALHVENCSIMGFRPGSAANGFGIAFQPAGASELTVNNCTVTDNGSTGVDGGGIQVRPTGAGSAKATLNNVRAHNNLNGITLNGNSSTGGIKATIVNSVSSDNTLDGLLASTGAANSPITGEIMGSTFANNAVVGVQADGAGANLLIGSSTVTGNGQGVSPTNGGAIASYKNNQINFNTLDGTPLSQVNLN